MAEGHPQAASAARVVSRSPSGDRPSLWPPRPDPTLADLDLAILPGELAVAENAAVRVDGRALVHRAVFVITNHLVLVVRAGDVVHHTCEAYDRLTARPHGDRLFSPGPSKTADIEQVLVIGAQDARTCTVLLVG